MTKCPPHPQIFGPSAVSASMEYDAITDCPN